MDEADDTDDSPTDAPTDPPASDASTDPPASGVAPRDAIDAALATLSDDDARALVAGLDRGDADAMARLLGVPPSAVRKADAPAALLRRRLARKPAEVQVSVARTLVADCLDDTVAALGDAADDPTRDQLAAVLDGVVATHGTGVTRLMLAAMVAPDAPAREVCAALLAQDPRFAVDDVPPLPDDAPRPVTTGRMVTAPTDDPDAAAKRAARRNQRAAKKAEAKAAERRKAEAAARVREQRKRAKRGG